MMIIPALVNLNAGVFNVCSNKKNPRSFFVDFFYSVNWIVN